MPSKLAWFAWAFCGVAMLGALFMFVNVWGNPAFHADPLLLLNHLTSALFPIPFGVTGALILARQAKNPIGQLLMIIALSTTVFGALDDYIGLSVNAAQLNGVQFFIIWLSGWSWWLLIGPLLLILLLFPTGQLLSSRWRWVVGMVGFLFISFLGLITLAPEWSSLDTGKTVPNPLGQNLLPADFAYNVIHGPWVLTLVSTTALCVLSVAVRYRRANAIEREQLKWFLFAGLIFIVIYASMGLLTAGEDPPAWAGIMLNVALTFFPVSVGIAILRYRLWDIDLLIRRTLQYSLLSGVLALTYFGLVIVLQSLLSAVGGPRSELLTVASTLTIAALFFPLRNRVQAFIDKRFYRRKYDAQKVLAEFAATCRDETDIEKLTARLTEVVQETMQPESVGVWLKPVAGERRKPSTRDAL